MRIGVTGSFGTGKTTVAEMFKNLGATLIDADKIVHTLIGRKRRKELAQILFKDRKSVNNFCKIIHPYVIEKIKNFCKRHKNEIVVIDAPLLIEADLHKDVDLIVVVATKRALQFERLLKKTKLSRKDITKRIRFQISLPKKIEMADIVIDNNGTLSKTREQVERIWKRVNK